VQEGPWRGPGLDLLERLAALGQDVEAEAAVVVHQKPDRQQDAGSVLGWV